STVAPREARGRAGPPRGARRVSLRQDGTLAAPARPRRQEVGRRAATRTDGSDRAQGPNLLPRRADALPLPGELARVAAGGDQGVPAGRRRGQAGTRRGAGAGELRGLLPAALRRRDLEALH